MIRVGIAAVVLISAFIGSVILLNATVYSPVGYVQAYVDALVRKDPGAALGLAGPLPSSSAIDDLLTEDVMADLEILQVAELESAGPRHLVEVRYRAEGREGRTEFELEDTGRVLGLFTQWSFARTPLVQLDLRVLHAQDFTANGARRVAPVAGMSATYLAFTPGAIAFAHESPLLSAAERTIVFGAPSRPLSVTIDAVANDAFVELVRTQSTAYLDACATQQVLYPVGCPFGQDIADRLAAAPQWSIVDYPAVSIVPTSTLGEWMVPVTEGVAVIDVKVRSIYDGAVTPFSSAVTYRVGYVVTLVGDEIIVTPRLG